MEQQIDEILERIQEMRDYMSDPTKPANPAKNIGYINGLIYAARKMESRMSAQQLERFHKFLESWNH